MENCPLHTHGLEDTGCFPNAGHCTGLAACGSHLTGGGRHDRTLCLLRALAAAEQSEAGSLQAEHRRQFAFEAICLLERETRREGV